MAALAKSPVTLGIGAAALGATWYFAQSKGPPNNAAFVFVKPHAVTEKANQTVRNRLLEKGMKVTGEGSLTSDVIDKKKLIDQHYYAIASKATILKPNQLNIPKDKFKASFGKDWDAALSEGLCLNALDACEFFGCTSDELNAAWGAAKKSQQTREIRRGILLR